MFCILKKKKYNITHKHNSNREKQVILLMISNGEKQWHYLAVKKLSALLRGIASKHGGFYCLNCFCSFATKNKLQLHKRVRGNKDSCNIIMPSEKTRILEFNQYQKSDKAPFIIYADLEYIIEKIDGCKNNPENLSATNVSEHIPSSFSMSTISSFRSTENKFCEFLRKQAMKTINFKKKKNEVINKRAAGIIWKYKNLLYL